MPGSSTLGSSRPVESNQQDIHDNLLHLVKRYQQSTLQRPISDHTIEAFNAVLPWLSADDRPLILDACCGVGESTAVLAKRYPQAKILGVDKSRHRLDKHHAYTNTAVNYKVIRADLNDFWRLLVNTKIKVSKHYLLYPNPYPKASQIQKRWYASGVTPYMLQVAPLIEVRSNWRLYLQEFTLVAKCYGFAATLTTLPSNNTALTPFERKYMQSGQPCYQLNIEKVNV